MPFRELLLDTLMRSSLVEVHDILIQNVLELLLLQDEQMIEAFLSDAPHIAFADGISSWGMIRRFQHLDAARFRHTSKARPEFAVVIPLQTARDHSVNLRELAYLTGHDLTISCVDREMG